MDRITKSHLEAFKQEQSLADLAEDEAFELFAGYYVVSDAYDDEFDIHDVHVGGEGDLSLDGVAIIVNGALVSSAEEVGDLVRINGYIDATVAAIDAVAFQQDSGGLGGQPDAKRASTWWIRLGLAG